jgi:hypothetical protein
MLFNGRKGFCVIQNHHDCFAAALSVGRDNFFATNDGGTAMKVQIWN